MEKVSRPVTASIGLVAVFVALLSDQLHKYWMLEIYGITEGRRVAITPFFDLTLVWNKGISYGLFRQEDSVGRYILIGFALVAAIFLAVWMVSAGSRLIALSLGLIVGGALGNVADRLFRAEKAVADFFSFHYGDFYWYVFNIADVAIAIGVTGLLLDWIIHPDQDAQDE
jgi:signal peptidase II